MKRDQFEDELLKFCIYIYVYSLCNDTDKDANKI